MRNECTNGRRNTSAERPPGSCVWHSPSFRRSRHSRPDSTCGRRGRCAGRCADQSPHLHNCCNGLRVLHPIVIACPFLYAVADAGVARMHAPIVGRLICIEDRATTRHVAFNNGLVAHLVGAPTDQAQDRRPVIGVGAFALAFHPEGTRRVGAVGRQGRDGAYFFSPAF